MHVPYRWLQDFFPDDVLPVPQALAEKLTMAGIEVESIESSTLEAPGIIVAVIEAIEPLSEGLNRVHINFGMAQASVVCAASNLRVGAKIPYAAVGARLQGKIVEEALIHGMPSQGMLCSYADLGLEEASDGVWLLPDEATVGQALNAWWGDESVLVLKLTPNRGDCLSMLGIAREVAALYGLEFTFPWCPSPEIDMDDQLPVAILEPDWCAIYMGALARLEDKKSTPLWMLKRLVASGVRPIHLLVDITNYVMLELGQPLHAFDADTLKQGIAVRLAKAGERLALLNGTDAELAADTLVIADHEKPIALAGIMGGLISGIKRQTNHVFFESAHFRPEAVRGKARRFKLTSEAAHRFERGVDPDLPEMALKRALFLAKGLGQAKIGPLSMALGNKPQIAEIAWRPQNINRLLGTQWSEDTMRQTLEKLAINLRENGGCWQAYPPSYRFDLALEEDLAEEIARVVGYDQIASSLPVSSCAFLDHQDEKQRIRAFLSARDYVEVITYAFSEPNLESLFAQGPFVELLNPIMQTMPILRAALWGKLLEVVRANQSRKIDRLRIFEIGHVFAKRNGQIEETEQVAAAVMGPWFDRAWKNHLDTGFFEVKKDLEALSPFLQFKRDTHQALHPGQSARIFLDHHAIGWLGVLHPAIAKQLELDPVILFSLELQGLLFPKTIQLKEISIFPEMRRDLSLLLPISLEWQTIAALIQQEGGTLLQKCEVFDLYVGTGVPENTKSLGARLFFQAYDRTLTDEEVDDKIGMILQALLPLGVRLREGARS